MTLTVVETHSSTSAKSAGLERPCAFASTVLLLGPDPDFLVSQVTLSVVEIYCERIRDLLDPSKDNLGVVADKARGVTVQDATEVPVSVLAIFYFL